MLTSFVVRLAASALRDGRLAGEVEHVASGARGTFADGDELASWCRRTASTAAQTAVPPPRPPQPAHQSAHRSAQQPSQQSPQ